MVTAPRSTKPWEVVKAQLAPDQRRVAAYERLMEAEHRIAHARARAGVTDAEIDRALAACEPGDPAALTDEQLYAGTVARFVAALGGRLEGATAVFGDETIALPGTEGDVPLPP